jgi:AraC family transcriptional regulator, regulatory protein of adaptative response / DNA-3-methyladenine glycosylase II
MVGAMGEDRCMDIEDTEGCYRAVKSRDRRFDGVFYTGVKTTGIYCRPSCPAKTPHQKNVEFYRTAAAAQQAGFRACRRCLPDATPGSPDWDIAADATGRAMRLISDGVVDREGVEGLARRVGYTSRHLSRLLTTELGAGPLALARAKRAQTARVLVETTAMSFADVAFASGFTSVRQFNDTIREVYASSPTELRGRHTTRLVSPGQVELRLAVRQPFAADELVDFLAIRAVPGVEAAGPRWYERSLRLPHGQGTARLTVPPPGEGSGTTFVNLTLRLCDLRDVAAAVERCRRLLDADCDPVAVDEELGADPRLAPLVRTRPGLRVPGHVDGNEIAVRAVLGQQISVARARALAGLLVERYGEMLPSSAADVPAMGPPQVSHLFPSAEVLAEVDPADISMPRARGRALNMMCAALARGDIPLDRSADRSDVRAALLELPGVGPWTADYIAMRALGDPDVFLPTDVGVRHAMKLLGQDPTRAEEISQAWRPWRSYAQMHLWGSLSPKEK